MAKNYATLAFTDSVKALQELHGSRRTYARVAESRQNNGLSEQEIGFISERDSFYLASIGENGYPYIQHRGGPAGFIKALDAHTLGIVDFEGNKQYITVGNLQTHPQVSLIMVDYPRQARLKLYADARIVELKEDPALFQQLDPADYPHRPERMILFTIQAYDWNCPQHITARYTLSEIQAAFAPQQAYLEALEKEVLELRAAQKDQVNAPEGVNLNL